MSNVCYTTSATLVMGEKISWFSALLLTVLLATSLCEKIEGEFMSVSDDTETSWDLFSENLMMKNNKVCDEIYVVKEGETLHSISEKCGDPFIVEENPHINDPDDVFPGLVLKITPFKNR